MKKAIPVGTILQVSTPRFGSSPCRGGADLCSARLIGLPFEDTIAVMFPESAAVGVPKWITNDA